MKHLSFFVLLLLFSACSQKADFRSDLSGNKTPWTGIPKGKKVDNFVFAVIGDLNSGERPAVFDVAVEQLKLLQPDLTLSIGDLIEGGTIDTVQLKKEYDHFDERVLRTGIPFFHVGGNHDLTNPVMRSYWEKRYGQRYYHFVYKNVLFLVLDSEDYAEERMWQIFHARAKAIALLDSGKTAEAQQTEYFKMPERATGEISDEQSAYFEKVIQENPDVRWTFVLMHKPVWQRESGGNLSRIEAALAQRKHTILNGHLHSYAYSLNHDSDYIMMGTTSGGQDAKKPGSFDHFLWVYMDDDGPVISNLRLDGILDKTGHIPAQGDSLCYQASRCNP